MELGVGKRTGKVLVINKHFMVVIFIKSSNSELVFVSQRRGHFGGIFWQASAQ